MVPVMLMVTSPPLEPVACEAPACAATTGSVLDGGLLLPKKLKPGRLTRLSKLTDSVPPPPLMLSASMACEPWPSTVMSPAWLTVTGPPRPPAPPPVAPTISEIELDSAMLPTPGSRLRPTLASPPPPPMLSARMPSALAPWVMISPVLVTKTAPPLPPSPPRPPMVIIGACCVVVPDPIWAESDSAMAPSPPPPPIDWATMPCAPSPKVSIRPRLSTVTVPPSPPVPPKPPMFRVKLALSLPAVMPKRSATAPPWPPPPPIESARIP